MTLSHNILPKILASITRHPRYIQELKWSPIWVENVFRVWERVFGRRYGKNGVGDTIRAEYATRVFGKSIHRYFYTWESLLIFIECEIRGFFKKPKFAFRFVPVLQPAGFGQPIPIFSFAIAHDADAASADATASPYTWSHTCASSAFLAVGTAAFVTAASPVTTPITYNSVSMTEAKVSTIAGATDNYESSVWFLGNPSSGANTVSVTTTNLGAATGHAASVSVSYTGAQTGSTADATGGTTGTTTGAKTFTVTVVAANSWIFAVCVWAARSLPTLTATQTTRGNVSLGTITVSGLMNAEDTNAAEPTGNFSMGFTVGGTQPDAYAMAGASFAPGGGAAVVVHPLTILGAG